ncbi:MAG: dehydro coenzyme reductase / coenzyme F420-0:L-glutamate ligase / coenzyme [Frankiaceae bacterium]|nr:dehydro coenzyme reductase / coenzyme F420-0:L-glutamate ligase / coenzyme [Frankiaceae bacterium]
MADAAARLEVLAVQGIPEVHEGDDLAGLIVATGFALLDDDIVVVTSKVVSKAEGRLVPAIGTPAEQESARQRAIDDESTRSVAARGPLRITATRHGFVMANAGVDASNVPAGTIALLPLDSDESARGIAARLAQLTGRRVAVVVSDTFGRPWRRGLTDLAIGAAGIEPIRDYRGQHDSTGRELAMTEMADIDEIAAAAELVMGKTAGVPVAVVRGLSYAAGDSGVAALVRPAAEDLFPLGTAEARLAGTDAVALIATRRTVRDFAPDRVDPAAIQRAVAAAITAPAPHHSTPWRFVLIDSDDARSSLMSAMRTAWAADLGADGVPPDVVARRIAKSDALLGGAPCLVVPCLVTEAAQHYPDTRRSAAERDMFVVSMGAAVQNFLVALTADGLGSCWLSTTLFCQDAVRRALALPGGWDPMGTIAIGKPARPASPRASRDPRRYVIER